MDRTLKIMLILNFGIKQMKEGAFVLKRNIGRDNVNSVTFLIAFIIQIRNIYGFGCGAYLDLLTEI